VQHGGGLASERRRMLSRGDLGENSQGGEEKVALHAVGRQERPARLPPPCGTPLAFISL